MCISCDCGLLDLPPIDQEIMQHNEKEKKEYFQIIDALPEFKAGIQINPPIGRNGKALLKAPTPSIKQDIITCKCRNNKWENCIVKCFYDGKQFEFGQCPLCICNCRHACTFENYFQGAAYQKATKSIKSKEDSEQQARDWMNNLTDVNLLGVRVIGDHFEKQMETGWLGNASNIAAVAFEHGALAAATHAIPNCCTIKDWGTTTCNPARTNSNNDQCWR